MNSAREKYFSHSISIYVIRFSRYIYISRQCRQFFNGAFINRTSIRAYVYMEIWLPGRIFKIHPEIELTRTVVVSTRDTFIRFSFLQILNVARWNFFFSPQMWIEIHREHFGRSRILLPEEESFTSSVCVFSSTMCCAET